MMTVWKSGLTQSPAFRKSGGAISPASFAMLGVPCTNRGISKSTRPAAQRTTTRKSRIDAAKDFVQRRASSRTRSGYRGTSGSAIMSATLVLRGIHFQQGDQVAHRFVVRVRDRTEAIGLERLEHALVLE